MTKRNQAGEKNADKGPLQRGANPDRYGANGGAEARRRELTERRQNDPGSLTEDEVKELATLEELGGVSERRTGAASSAGAGTGEPNPGDPAPPQDVIAGEGSDRTIDRSGDFNQEREDRDLNIEGLHDGPGGRKYLVLNLTDDADALTAAKAYGAAVSQSKPELAIELAHVIGVGGAVAGSSIGDVPFDGTDDDLRKHHQEIESAAGPEQSSR